MGNVHRYGDRRMPIPGAVGMIAAAASAAFAAVAGRWAAAIMAAAALALLLVWLALYLRVSAPINRQLTAAAQAGEVPRMLVRCKQIGTGSSMRARHCRAWPSVPVRRPDDLKGTEGYTCFSSGSTPCARPGSRTVRHSPLGSPCSQPGNVRRDNPRNLDTARRRRPSTHRADLLPGRRQPDALARDFMASPEFAADMEGFDPEDIVAVDSIPLDATGSSPI